MVSILIGNKKDLAEKWIISRERAEEFAKKHGISYLEVSSKNYENVDEAFMIPC